MAKTPVSILQEMSAQLKIAPPQYDLIHNHPEGVASEFRFQVSFNGVVAVGAGRSKKEARHNAAEMAITKLNQQKAEKKLSVAMSVLSHGESVASPFNNQVTRNYVGELAEVCATNQLPAPLYKEVMAEGPSHAPSFTLSCCVSQFTETAQASTKKQAKHCVAKKMLARIEECLLSETFKSVPGAAQQTADSTTAAGSSAAMLAAAEADQDRKVKATVLKALRQKLILPTMHSSRPVAEMHLEMEEKYGAAPPKLLTASGHDRKSSDWNPYVRVQKLAEEMAVSCYIQINKIGDDSSLDIDEDISYYLYVSEADKEAAAPTVIEYIDDDDNKKEDCCTDKARYFVKIFLVTSPLSVVFGQGTSLREAKTAAAERMIAHLNRMILGLPKFR